jgi:1,4-dihydroxy-2-naphthoyl-CoA hydrolase
MPDDPKALEERVDNWGGVLGLEIVEWSGKRVEARLEPDSRHEQPYGILHGGVYASIVEDVASRGAGAAAREAGRAGIVGVANQTDFLRSHKRGELRAVGEPIHVGRSVQLWQVVITRSSDGATVARGQVRFHVLDELPADRGRKER